MRDFISLSIDDPLFTDDVHSAMVLLSHINKKQEARILELETKMDKMFSFLTSSDGTADGHEGLNILEDKLGRMDSGLRKFDALHDSLIRLKLKSEVEASVASPKVLDLLQVVASKEECNKQLEDKIKSMEGKIESSHEQHHEQSRMVQKLNDIKSNQDAKLEENALQLSQLSKKLQHAEEALQEERRLLLGKIDSKDHVLYEVNHEKKTVEDKLSDTLHQLAEERNKAMQLETANKSLAVDYEKEKRKIYDKLSLVEQSVSNEQKTASQKAQAMKLKTLSYRSENQKLLSKLSELEQKLAEKELSSVVPAVGRESKRFQTVGSSLAIEVPDNA